MNKKPYKHGLGLHQDKQKQQHRHTKPERQLCAKFIEGLRSAKLISRSPKLSSWAYHFKDLIHRHDVDEVSQVLDWYLCHIGSAEVPQIVSAVQFANLFDRLRILCYRTGQNDVSSDLLQKCLSWGWPAGCDLALLLHDSLINYTKFFSQVKVIRGQLKSQTERTHDENLLLRFTDNLKDRRLLSESSERFVLNWAIRVHQELVNWPSWKGDLRMFVFDLSKEYTQRTGRVWANEYHRSSCWDLLMERLNENPTT